MTLPRTTLRRPTFRRPTLSRPTLRRLWLGAILVLYLVLTCYQLGLPGLHYDEAREAGINAMEIITGAPVTAFRGAGILFNGRTFPLMVQDYIGALNVYLALPFLVISGIGVPNLRLLPVLIGLVALLLIERSVSEWVATSDQFRLDDESVNGTSPLLSRGTDHVPLSLSALIAVTLLAASPSYVFWARQGIFVTNLTLPLVFLCLWQALRWLRTGRTQALLVAAAAGGMALYAKLLAIWLIAPFGLLAGTWWLVQRARHPARVPPLSLRTLLATVAVFVVPLLPLIFFNLQSGGTVSSIGGNLGQSYYGVDNADILGNLPVRWAQLIQVLRGNQFWYLGGNFANALAPWLAVAALAVGLWRNWRRTLPPWLLAAAAFACSLFTVSDLFVTHYALLQPLVVAAIAVALGCWLDQPHDPARERTASSASASPARSHIPEGERTASSASASPARSHIPARERTASSASASPAHSHTPARARYVIAVVVVLWLAFDLAASIRYHASLSATGGLADHSDASYHLAYHLRYNGMGAPIALDWGLDAPVRYLTAGTVTPIEIFGYESPVAPDRGFAERLAPFLANPDNRYLLHAPGTTVFQGRREAFLAAVATRHGTATVEQQFAQRDGTPLVEIWRVE